MYITLTNDPVAGWMVSKIDNVKNTEAPACYPFTVRCEGVTEDDYQIKMKDTSFDLLDDGFFYPEGLAVTLKIDWSQGLAGKIRLFDGDYNEFLAPDVLEKELTGEEITALTGENGSTFFLEGVEGGRGTLIAEIRLNDRLIADDRVIFSVMDFNVLGAHTFGSII